MEDAIKEVSADITTREGVLPLQNFLISAWEHRDFAVCFAMEGGQAVDSVPLTAAMQEAFATYEEHKPLVCASRPVAPGEVVQQSPFTCTGAPSEERYQPDATDYEVAREWYVSSATRVKEEKDAEDEQVEKK